VLGRPLCPATVSVVPKLLDAAVAAFYCRTVCIGADGSEAVALERWDLVGAILTLRRNFRLLAGMHWW
jgi:hypothetical protein